MKRNIILTHPFILALGCLVLASGCATPLPPTYTMPGQTHTVPGPVTALVVDEERVAAAGGDGVYVKAGEGDWERLEIPGLKDPSRVTCLALHHGRLFVGTDGEGLHILSAGSWEVVNRKYSGLPGDDILALAVDGEGEGLPGDSVWVATGKGVAAFRDGAWTMYTPEGEWIDSLPGSPADEDDGEVYLAPGFELVGGGRIAERFTPPVTAVAVGPDRVVFANRGSRLAVVDDHSVAVVHFLDGRVVRSLLVDEDVIWAGSEMGLLWGGVSGRVAGRPWPGNHPQVPWFGSFSGARDTRPFQYRWFEVGYSNAPVSGLAREGRALWVAFTRPSHTLTLYDPSPAAGAGGGAVHPIIDLRRYLNIAEYIAREEKQAYESYGKDDGLMGDTLSVAPVPGRREVWVGTEKGLYLLTR